MYGVIEYVVHDSLSSSLDKRVVVVQQMIQAVYRTFV